MLKKLAILASLVVISGCALRFDLPEWTSPKSGRTVSGSYINIINPVGASGLISYVEVCDPKTGCVGTINQGVVPGLAESVAGELVGGYFIGQGLEHSGSNTAITNSLSAEASARAKATVKKGGHRDDY